MDEKQGYAKSIIECRIKILKRLTNLGASLYDPEQIKEVTAKQLWSNVFIKQTYNMDTLLDEN